MASISLELTTLLGALVIFAFAALRRLRKAKTALLRADSDNFPPPFLWSQQEPKAAQRAAVVAASGHVRLKASPPLPATTMRRRARRFFDLMAMRRSLRFFAPTPIPSGVVEKCIETASSAPSGAHKQPWRFVLVDSASKRREIRALVEAEEHINYKKRMRQTWVDDCLKVVGDLHGSEDIQKPYLSTAPQLLVVFKETYGVSSVDGARSENYYVQESCGIAVGLLIAALQNVGIATLTSTPMGAEKSIRAICGRGANEKVFLLMPLGFPAKDATVPYRAPGALRLPLSEVLTRV
jgi:iodotyrosine deiodinase|tara:strand:+ start:109 stop:993 length:885 start_codon:yes stop_codon:yes gene_type:complete